MKDLLAQLNRLAADRNEWEHSEDRSVLEKTINGITMQVRNTEVGAMWCVREGNDVFLRQWSEAPNVVLAMRACTGFVRAYLLTEQHPAH